VSQYVLVFAVCGVVSLGLMVWLTRWKGVSVFRKLPVRLLAFILWEFFIEGANMAALDALALDSYFLEGLLDSTVLVLMTLPAGYFLFYLPLIQNQQKLLKESKERLLLARAIEQTADAVMITESSGVIRYVNPAFEKITGYSREEVVGKDPKFLKSGMQDQEVYQSLWSALTQGKVWQGRFINRRKDGTLFDIEATISPVVDQDGTIKNYIAVEKDISDELKLSARLSQAQKLEAIGLLAGGIAHDFNNILTPIVGYTEMLQMMAKPQSRQSDFLERIGSASKRAQELVSQILLFSRQKKGVVRVLKVEPVFKETLKLMSSVIPSSIHLQQHLEDNLLRVKADASQIHTLLMNLCTNATHAMPEGGILIVSAKNVDLKNKTVEGVPFTGKFVLLEVTDNGMGMDLKTQSRIFEPFFTTKEIGKGTGIGLATVFGIARDHGGFIQVESSPGLGSTFKVYLPGVDGPEEIPNPFAEKDPLGKESVLLVDDDPEIAHYGKLALEHWGYQVAMFTDAHDALTRFKKHPDRFDLLITDQSMPGYSGLRLAHLMREIKPELAVLFCSGFLENLSEELRNQISGEEIVPKPYSARDIGWGARKALERIHYPPLKKAQEDGRG